MIPYKNGDPATTYCNEQANVEWANAECGCAVVIGFPTRLGMVEKSRQAPCTTQIQDEKIHTMQAKKTQTPGLFDVEEVKNRRTTLGLRCIQQCLRNEALENCRSVRTEN